MVATKRVWKDATALHAAASIPDDRMRAAEFDMVFPHL
jgi:hypothetical protein